MGLCEATMIHFDSGITFPVRLQTPRDFSAESVLLNAIPNVRTKDGYDSA